MTTFKKMLESEKYDKNKISSDTRSTILELGDKVYASQSSKGLNNSDAKLIKDIQKLFDKLEITKYI